MPGLPYQIIKPPRLFARVVGLLPLAVLMITAPASAQSFNCQKAYYPDEETICGDSHLGQLDQQLASVYGRWVAKLPKERRDEIEGNETLFVRARRRCGRDRNCIEQSYRNRIEEIQESLAEREAAPGSANAKASVSHEQSRQAPTNRQTPQKSGSLAKSVTPPKEPTQSPSQPAPAPESGSTGWVNPPPER
jgi:uncharacterized protein